MGSRQALQPTVRTGGIPMSSEPTAALCGGATPTCLRPSVRRRFREIGCVPGQLPSIFGRLVQEGLVVAKEGAYSGALRSRIPCPFSCQKSSDVAPATVRNVHHRGPTPAMVSGLVN